MLYFSLGSINCNNQDQHFVVHVNLLFFCHFKNLHFIYQYHVNTFKKDLFLNSNNSRKFFIHDLFLIYLYYLSLYIPNQFLDSNVLIVA